MSMVSDLLFGVMPNLPGGKSRKHVCLTNAVKAFRKGQRAVQERNVEAVYQAIADGHYLNIMVQEVTKLSKTAVFNSCQVLLKAGRITVDKAHRPYCFSVKEK